MQTLQHTNDKVSSGGIKMKKKRLNPKISIEKDSKVYRTKDGKTAFCYYNVERATVDESAYPELAKALTAWFDSNKEMLERKGGTIPDEAKNADDITCYVQQSISTKRVDEKVISLDLKQYEFYGGTHGESIIYGLTFDTRTGKELTQADVIADQNKFEEVALDYIIRQAENMLGEGLYPEYKEIIKEKMENLTWMLTDYGMQVVFQEYDIAPYAAGPVYVDLPYSLLKDSFAKEYLPDISYLKFQK